MVIWESVDALVAAWVAVCIVDDHIVWGHGQVDPQLITWQATLGLEWQRIHMNTGDLIAPFESVNQMVIAQENQHLIFE